MQQIVDLGHVQVIRVAVITVVWLHLNQQPVYIFGLGLATAGAALCLLLGQIHLFKPQIWCSGFYVSCLRSFCSAEFFRNKLKAIKRKCSWVDILALTTLKT